MAWAQVLGVRLFYERAGSGPPVVYVHGGFASLATRLADFSDTGWPAGAWELEVARRFDFVSYERRGCYRSDAPPDGYDPKTQADDLVGLLDALGLESAHLVGSSAGGPIATVCAAAYPGRVRSIVLAGTALQVFPPNDPFTAIIRRMWEVLMERGADAAFDARPNGVEATYGSLWGHIEAEARGRLVEYRSRSARLDARARTLPRAERIRWHEIDLRNMMAYIDSDIRADAERVRCPALVLHGSDDRDVPLPLGRLLAETIPGAVLRVLEGFGHSVVHRTAKGRAVTTEWIAAQEAAHRGV